LDQIIAALPASAIIALLSMIAADLISSRINRESIKRVVLNKLKTNTLFYPLYDSDSHVGRDRINVSMMMILSRGGI
jgi:hypothetical protein